MVKFVLEKGRKSENDTVIVVYADGEVFSFSEILFLLSHYFRSEESYYPKPKYEGSLMLLKAILEVYSNIPFEIVLKKYGLNRKRKLDIVDNRIKGIKRNSQGEAKALYVHDFM
jgi:hypothetical protein